jgi:hypothetical protein
MNCSVKESDRRLISDEILIFFREIEASYE